MSHSDAWGPVPLLPLLPHRDALVVHEVVGAQDAVQVVQLVLEELAHTIRELSAVLLSVLVLVVDADSSMPLDVDEDSSFEAEAAVPAVEEFVALFHNIGVH